MSTKTVWIVEYADILDYFVNRRAFDTKAEAQAFYDAHDWCVIRKMYQTEDIWG